jgi:hypothetical protein
VLEHAAEQTEEVLGGGGSGGGGSGAGGTGGSGGPGGSSPGTTLLILGGSPVPGPGSPAPAAPKAIVGKLKIVRHTVKGRHATVVVQVPAAGVVTLAAKRVHKVRCEAARSERVTLSVALTRAAASALHRGHHLLKVALKVSFRPTSGSASAASVALSFRRG